MRRLVVMAAVAALGCDAVPRPPPEPPPVDGCEGLVPVTALAAPRAVAVNGASTVSATGGSGRYTFVLATNTTGATLSGDRYIAGPTAGDDVVRVSDDCGSSASITITVRAAFAVAPARATVAPGTRFTIEATGAVGGASFTPQHAALASGGSISAAGEYTAGASPGLDLIVVRDGTGQQVVVQYQVEPGARFRPAIARLALPAGARVPLATAGGTSEVTWATPPAGRLIHEGQRTFFEAPADGGTFTLGATDRFTGEQASVAVRVLTELERPGNPAQGRRTDVASMVAADLDGDGVEDLAVGRPESDLSRPLGGAVFIYRGGPGGLPAEPTWTITGTSDTAQLGTVLAAGDLTGDGRADLAISAPGDDLTVADSGAVYLYTFTAAGPQLIRPPLTGLGRGNFGAALAIADVDGDGDGDLVVGSPGADLAPGGGFTARGVVDVFILQAGQPVPDLGTVRLSGRDLTPDGGLRNASNLRAGRSLVVQDLDGDGKADLAFLTSVNNTFASGARNVIAVQVHLNRGSGGLFAADPDAYVLPATTSDGDEGTWRLTGVPGGAGRPPLLVAAADRLDSPNLSAMDAGTPGGTNAGGALLFDLRTVSAGPPLPRQLARDAALARLYGDAPGISAGRSVAVASLAPGRTDLVLGAPSATTGGLSSAGKLIAYHLDGLPAGGGTVRNRPDLVRAGTGRGDVLGIAVAPWNGQLAALAGRASTPLGDFLGRLDAFGPGPDPAAWPVTSSPLPGQPASQGFGAAVDVGPLGSRLRAAVGVPLISGPGSDGLGNEPGAGQALAYGVELPRAPSILAEGASTPYLTDAGHRALGGRPVGTDVAMTDFDGDGRLDVAVAAPSFPLPVRTADGGTSTQAEYAAVRQACLAPSSQTVGAARVFLGRADGTFREGFRVWAGRDIEGCVVPPGGAASSCQRSQLGLRGVEGGLDFDGDGRQDLAMAAASGLEVFAGQPPDDPQATLPTMACDVLFSMPRLPWPTFSPRGLGDLDGDGCDEVGISYSDGNNRRGVVIAFGFSTAGAGRCGGKTGPSMVRISGDTETGVPTMRLGVAMTRAGAVTATSTDYLAITADLYPYQGQNQPAVLLVETSQVVARRPASGTRLVSILGDGLTPVPLVVGSLVTGFGASMVGNVNVLGDGKPELVVSATGASENGDGTGAVYVFQGGTVRAGLNGPALLVVGDQRERGLFGADVAVSPAAGGVPAAIAIGAPASYRSGTANGTAFVLPLDF